MNKATDYELRLRTQLIQCWADIRKWSQDNCKDITITVPLKCIARLEIDHGKAIIIAAVDNKAITIKQDYVVIDTKRHRLKSYIRSNPMPFAFISDLVTEWTEYKQQILTEIAKRDSILTFKP